ncbi:MAG: hypothetical protein WC742_12885 [Gallionellaceae bacterium]|jgi:hypothetical protein
MPVESSLMDRIRNVVSSPNLKVVPIGEVDDVNRGILRVRDFGKLQDVVKMTFAAAVVAAAMAMPNVSHAQGVGYDAGVYGQGQGQVMQAGTAMRMEVVAVRPVNIEVAAPAQRNNSGMGYAVTAAAGGVGAVIGNNIGGNNQSSRQLGAILGGLIGAIGGNMASNAMNAPEEAKQIPGTEITLLNPVNNQLSVITQAGTQRFAEGDRVLVSSVGGNTRVVLDRSQVQSQNMESRTNSAIDPYDDIVNKATENLNGKGVMGVIRDANKESGSYIGTVVTKNDKYAAIDIGKNNLVVVPSAISNGHLEQGQRVSLKFNHGVAQDVSQQSQGRGRDQGYGRD